MRRWVGLLVLLALSGCGQTTSQHAARGSARISPIGSTPTSEPPKLSARGCFTDPERCNYPGPNDVGAEASTGERCSELRPSGSIVARTPGQRIEGLDITGHVDVEAPKVTLNDDCVTDHEGFGRSAVKMEGAASELTVSNSTIRGVNEEYGSVEIALQGSDVPGNVATNDLLYNCAECIHADWTLAKSYVDSNGLAPRRGVMSDGQAAHIEDWYYDGETVTARENTMFNPEYSVAIMFGDTNDGRGGACSNHIIFERNLIAGGGYLFYPCGNSSSPGTSTMIIKDNRFARCLTSEPDHEYPGPGGTKCGNGKLTPVNEGADSHGYFPEGGYFGVATAFYDGPAQRWEDNRWDNDLEIVHP